jgi:hypothetical protein
MMLDPQIMERLRMRATSDTDLANLTLQLAALEAAGNGDLLAASSLLSQAQSLESAHGYGRAALHTSHKMALITSFAGDLARIERYYTETLRTVRKLRNREGIGLCLRSLGELALMRARVPEAVKCWELSEKSFESANLSEARQLATWRRFIQQGERSSGAPDA